ncbi:hypothetical protein TGRUB_357890 [Toxoplasma gondii RUB]|uniref:Uncharacterized protein n=2 Tax=Toxoplasma gondii TaxID=5811 RepID=A0A086M725_TOXGO|nr:hypothetical protein TGFOU_357890 [Toxoplasma gondii FOU]KFG64693.1 hypothetical protein TGRUB_357890 [Toxoplasma gondii RUB]
MKGTTTGVCSQTQVEDVTRASLKTLPELLQQRGASDNKDFPLTLWSSNIQSHDLGVVSNGCSSDFVTAKLLSISLHGVPIASEVTLLPPSLELQLLPSLVHFERLLVVNNASCPAPFQLAPINRFVEVYPDKKEKRAGVGNSDMRIAAQSKGFSGFSTHDNDNEGPHSPSSCLSHGFASHKRVREGLLLVDMDEIENITRLGWETVSNVRRVHVTSFTE